MAIEAVISDFGGVLTSSLAEGFAAFEAESGVSLEELGLALMDAGQELGENPLFELERGRISEADFNRLLSRALARRRGQEVDLSRLGERLFGGLRPNQRMIEYMRSLRARGLKLAICTNNVREWEERWRASLPVDEIFHTVVDSAFAGVRKPDPAIYQLTLERLGVAPEAAVLVDDMDVNCDGARALGLHAVLFRDTAQAIAELEGLLQFATPSRSQQ